MNKITGLITALILAGVTTLSHADEVAEFRVIMGQCQATLAALPPVEVVYVAATKSWVKRAHSETAFAFDVRKTDSLVSPLGAYMEITELTMLDRAADEAAAHALDLTERASTNRRVHRVNYAYQGGRWTLVDGRTTSAWRRAHGSPFEAPRTFNLTEDELPSNLGRAGRCFTKR